MIPKLGLVGENISHSKSKSIYEEILKKEVSYTLFDYKSEDDIPRLSELFLEGLDGLSITSPYKSHFIGEVIIENEIVKKLGVINCIKKVHDRYFATNTDYLALESMIVNYIKKSSSVIILGNGKMAQVIIEILNKENVLFEQFSRSINGPIDKINLKRKSKNTLIINTCSRGYVFQGELDTESTFWDMNYSHMPHFDNLKGLCNYEDGLVLLKKQGEFAVQYWGIS